MATAARKPNWFAIWTSVIVAVIVVAVAATVVIGQNMANAPLEDAPVASAPTEEGVVTMGDGPTTVTTFVDFMCPACNQFESVYGDQLLTLAKDNKITLEVRPVNLLDGQSTTKYSTRAANAFFCVADTNGDLAATYLKALYKQQPREGGAGLDDDKLVSIASGYGVDIKSCQTEQTFAGLAVKNFETMPANANGQKGTPTVAIDGQYSTDFQQSNTWFTDTFGG